MAERRWIKGKKGHPKRGEKITEVSRPWQQIRFNGVLARWPKFSQ